MPPRQRAKPAKVDGRMPRSLEDTNVDSCRGGYLVGYLILLLVGATGVHGKTGVCATGVHERARQESTGRFHQPVGDSNRRGIGATRVHGMLVDKLCQAASKII